MKIKTLTIDELCNVEYGTRVTRRKDSRDSEKIYPVYGGGSETFFIDKINRTNRVVIARFAMSEKCTRFVKGDFFLNDSGLTLSPKTSELSQEYLDKIILASNYSIYQLGRGTAQRNLDMKQFRLFKISFPTSLVEQKRIAAKLDAAFAEIDKAIQLTEKKIIEIEQFNTKALTSIYFDGKNKNLKTLKEIVSIKGGKRLPKGKKLTTENTGFPYIRVSDFNDDGTINLKSVKFIEADVRKQIERYTISSKDVYVSIAGTIGKTGIVPKILENANLTENAVKLVPHESVDKEFLYFFTKTMSFKKQAINQTRTTAQPKLALKRLGKVEIPLFDLKKQIKIVSKAKNIILWTKLTKENCYNKIEHLKKLKVAILKQKLKPKKAA